MIAKYTFLCVIFTTLFMTGLIWFVQVVHYPLFSQVNEEKFKQYESLHTTRTGWVVAPIMVLELITTVMLLLNRPGYIRNYEAWILVILTLGVWGSTFFIQVPLHGQLIDGKDWESIRKLVSSNWIRTVLWTVKGVVCCWIVGRLIV